MRTEHHNEEEMLKTPYKYLEWAHGVLGEKVFDRYHRAYYQYSVELPDAKEITVFISSADTPNGCGIISIDLQDDIPNDPSAFVKAARYNAEVLGFQGGSLLNVHEILGVQMGERIGDFACGYHHGFCLAASIVLVRVSDDLPELRYHHRIPEELNVAIVVTCAQKQLGKLLGWKIEPVLTKD